jgi:hypothetical protein
MNRLTTVLAVVAVAALGAGPVYESGPDGQRLEWPERGIAVTFPSDWTIEQTTYLSDEDPSLLPLVVAHAPIASWNTFDSCAVFDQTALAAMPPAWRTIADYLDYIELTSEAREVDLGIITTNAVLMELPAGEVGCVDGHDSMLGEDSRDYMYTDGESWFALWCMASIAPDDRWLSIAETFEFLPRADASPEPLSGTATGLDRDQAERSEAGTRPDGTRPLTSDSI